MRGTPPTIAQQKTARTHVRAVFLYLPIYFNFTTNCTVPPTPGASVPANVHEIEPLWPVAGAVIVQPVKLLESGDEKLAELKLVKAGVASLITKLEIGVLPVLEYAMV